MPEWLQWGWNYQIQVLPAIAALLFIEVPTAIRRRQKFYYVPIYFSVFPLRELNADLAHYLGEDYFTGGEPNEAAAESLRKKILLTSVLSIALSALVIPAFAGFGSAFFLTSAMLRQFVLVFLVYKAIGIIRALADFPTHAVGTKKNTLLLVLIYIGYLGVASRMIIRSYGFARAYVEKSDWMGLLGSTSDLIFSRVVAEFLLLAVITTAFTNYIMDRKIRAENIKSWRNDDAVG